MKKNKTHTDISSVAKCLFYIWKEKNFVENVLECLGLRFSSENVMLMRIKDVPRLGSWSVV
jgi:hypothetical protein